LCASIGPGASPITLRTMRPGAILVLSAAALLAGCGGNASGVTTSKARPGGRDPAAIARCLNDRHGFLVETRRSSVEGQSAGGVIFTLRLYPSRTEARTAASKRESRATALVGTGVADFRGNPSPAPGAPPGRLSRKELAAIRACLDAAGAG
jgi:hypothetical protein